LGLDRTPTGSHHAVKHRLIDVEDSLLVVIDVQAAFLDKLPPAEAKALLGRICWLIRVAHCLRVPLVVTAEDIPNLGSVHPQVSKALPPGTPVYNKGVFGLAEDPEILTAVKRTGRGTAASIGLETDVCVAQSAIGLQQNGYRVAAIADATGSPGAGHTLGLERIRGARVLVLGFKGLYYEWQRTVERADRFRAHHAPLVDAWPD
jgi:nicotinamidase-related amidase